MEKIFKEMIEKVKKEGFSVSIEEDTEDYIIFDFGKYSPAGQDFHISVEAEERSMDSLINNIYERYNDFDVSYESSLWLDDTGHGRNGAPYDMKDLYEDMEACEEYINDLYDIVNGFYADYVE